jgi:trehalose-phosphatase
MACPSEPAVMTDRDSEGDQRGSPVVGRKAAEKQNLRSYQATSAFLDFRSIVARLRAVRKRAVLLDFDGTLVPLRPYPSDVRVSSRVKKVLGDLVGNTTLFVAIVSGRKVRNLKELLDVKGLRYFGLHGAESERGTIRLPPSTRAALREAKQSARRSLRRWPAVWVEDKGLTFAVHFRQAGEKATHAASGALARLLEPWGDALHVLNGSRVWEVLPKELAGKSSAVKRILSTLPAGTPAVHIGDDATDEEAFKVLEDQITVRVGPHLATRARYYLRTPADVLRFLSRLEKALRE